MKHSPRFLYSQILPSVCAAVFLPTLSQSIHATPPSTDNRSNLVPRVSSRIVGGIDASRGAYPWMTALVGRGQTPLAGQFCGGALIHPEWVLTAAHCIEDTTSSSLDVVIGVHDLRNAGEGVRIAVSQIIPHPHFASTHGSLVNDFALLKLAHPATGVPLLPLVDRASQINLSRVPRAIGWGTTSEGGRGSPVLQQADLAFVNIATAGQVYDNLSEAHLAAAVPGGGRDTCQGDSGGPLIVTDGKGGWLHAGAVSYGDGCARPGIPGIYANTLTFRPWIFQQTGTLVGDDHGNTLPLASSATLDTPIQGILEVAGDFDVFRLSLTRAGTLNIVSSGTTDVIGSLSDSAGTLLTRDDNGAGAPNFRLSAPVTPGTYYLTVSGSTFAIGSYTLLAKVIPTTTAQPEISILGVSRSIINDGSVVASAALGTHFGSVDVTAGSHSSTFTVQNTGKGQLNLGTALITGPSAAHFRVAIQPVNQLAAGRSGTFTLTYDPLSPGWHTAEIIMPNTDPDENPYNFILTGTGTGGVDDHGNSITTATSVIIPSKTLGELGGTRDRDIFRFAVTQSTTLKIFTTGNLDTYGRLMDVMGQILVEKDDSGSDLNFRFQRKLSPGTYFIAVEGFTGQERGPYSLEITR